MKTGFKELDEIISLDEPKLIAIGGRPAMGKSAFAINIATNIAIKEKKGVAIFNLELSKEQVRNRIICSEVLVDCNEIRTGFLEDDEEKRIKSALASISDAPIYIDDTAGISLTEICAKCRKLKLEKDIGLIVIDYLQLIQGDKNLRHEQEISRISLSLKNLTKELNIPIIILSQLSRSLEEREDKRPKLSDLKESKMIEQDADIVILLYRDDYYYKDCERKNVADIIVAKNRGGDTRTIELAWLPHYMKFANLDRRFFEEKITNTNKNTEIQIEKIFQEIENKSSDIFFIECLKTTKYDYFLDKLCEFFRINEIDYDIDENWVENVVHSVLNNSIDEYIKSFKHFKFIIFPIEYVALFLEMPKELKNKIFEISQSLLSNGTTKKIIYVSRIMTSKEISDCIIYDKLKDNVYEIED